MIFYEICSPILLDMDKILLQEDRRVQEHYHWAKVEELWNFYLKQQKEILGPVEWTQRCKEDFYPKEAPLWFKKRFEHENMWKYGIWPQHSHLAHREHYNKHQKERIELTELDYYKENPTKQ